MTITNKVIRHLQSEQNNQIYHYDKSIDTLMKLLKRLPKNNIAERNSVRQGITSISKEKNRELMNKSLFSVNVSSEVIDELNYLNDIASEELKDNFEIFIEFTLKAYFKLQHPNTIIPKKVYDIEEYLSIEERHQAQIYSTNEILYELYEFLIEFGCDKDTARALQACISNNKRLPKEPTSSKEEYIKQGKNILRNK